MKICDTCKVPKDESEFNKNKSKKDGLNSICKECSRRRSKEYYKGNSKEHKKNVQNRTRKYRNTLRGFMLDYLKSHPCVDCENADIRVLEFDHLPEFEKTADISRLMSHCNSLNKIKEEIKKCEVVCANCHKIRTVERSVSNYRKQALVA